MILLRCRKIAFAALVAALLLEGSFHPVAEAGSRRRAPRQNQAWQPLPQASTRTPAIKPPSANGSSNPMPSPFLPTVRQPSTAVPIRPPSRSLGWTDMGNGAKIYSQNYSDRIEPAALSLIPDAPVEPAFPLYQASAAPPASGGLPQAGTTSPAPSPVAPITGAPSQGLLQPATSGSTTTSGPGNVLELPDEMNMSIRSLDFRQTDVKDALRSLASLINLNLMLANDIAGEVTVLFSDVSIEEAFNTLIRSFNLAFSWDGTILRIFKSENAPLVTRIFNIRNTTASSVKERVDKVLLSEKGKSEVDLRTNALIITDTSTVLEKIHSLLPQLDVREAEVEVTARPITEVFYLDYVDASVLQQPIQTIAKEAVIQSFSSSQASQAGAAGGGTATGRQDMMIITDTPNNLERIREIIEKLDIAPLQVTIDAQIYEIDLNEEERLGINWQKQIPIAGTSESVFDMSISPEESTAGGTGVFRFGSLSVNQFRALLAMLKTHSFAKVLSNPVITTLNNRQANITVGQAIPYISASQVNAQTGQVTNTVSQANANISLQVTPSVTGNDEVFLDINPTISSVLGFTTLGGNSTPNLSNRTAQTQVIVRNNHTIVIGGMIKTDKSDSISKVPFLGDLPGVGKLFQKKTTKETRTELIIFITPHIVRPGPKSRSMDTAKAGLTPRVSVQP
ncbi:MAG TPA: secretin N-terminal domain-containing protein [Candidatus Ozemobacteraceae bacterium]|nr:secretin N-terminal domain-containing protein [Candidatus Ozemobacteraceae bacterium]